MTLILLLITINIINTETLMLQTENVLKFTVLFVLKGQLKMNYTSFFTVLSMRTREDFLTTRQYFKFRLCNVVIEGY